MHELPVDVKSQAVDLRKASKMMLEFLLFAVFFAVALIGLVFYLYPGSSRTTTIPGMDPSDPKDGNLGDVRTAGSMHQFLTELHATYGHIASFYWGSQLTVSVAAPHLCKDISKLFDRPAELFLVYEPLITESSVQYATGVEARSRRKLYEGMHSPEAMKHYSSMLTTLSQEFLGRLTQVPKDDVIPLGEYCVTFAMKAFCQIAFGDFFDSKQCKKMLHSYEMVWTELESQLAGDIPSPGDSRHDRLTTERENLFALLRSAMKHRKSSGGKDAKLLIDVLQASGQPEAVQLADALRHCVCGFHHIGTYLTWLFYYLSQHEEMEKRVLQELKDVLQGGVATAENSQDLIYTRQVLDESLRCSTLNTYTARVQDLDSELDGHVIPGKTPVVLALGVMCNDEKHWPDPEKFDPDRFSEKPSPYTFEPFGVGVRKCPGRDLAYQEALVVLSVILPKVKFTVQEGQVVLPKYGLVTKPNEEIWVTIEKRK